MAGKLWEDPEQLIVGDQMRAGVDTDGDVDEFGHGYRGAMLLGSAGLFRTQKWIDKVLGEVAVNIEAPDEAWKRQQSFFHQFIASFFSSGCDGTALPSDLPCWVHLRFAARPFSLRERQGKSRETTDEVTTKMNASDIRHESLSLNGQAIPMQRLCLLRPEGKGDDERLQLQQCRITREYTNTAGKLFLGMEDWTFLDDRSIFKLRKQPRTLTTVTEQFRDPLTLLQKAPLIALSRLSSDLKWIAHRCFVVSPYTGHVTDIRTGQFQVGFYFQSSSDTHALLKSALSNNGQSLSI